MGISRNKGTANPFYGRTHSEEARTKMRLAHKGKQRPPRDVEWSRRISQSKKGTMAGVSNPFFGKHHSDETRTKLSEIQRQNPRFKRCGMSPWNWQGCITNPRKANAEKHFRTMVLKRDKFICQQCGVVASISNQLEAHHLQQFAKYPERRFDPSNGITLCHNCHLETETYGGKANGELTGSRNHLDNLRGADTL